MSIADELQEIVKEHGGTLVVDYSTFARIGLNFGIPMDEIDPDQSMTLDGVTVVACINPRFTVSVGKAAEREAVLCEVASYGALMGGPKEWT